MSAVSRGEGSAYYEALAPTYDEAKSQALKMMKLQDPDVKVDEQGSSAEGVTIRVFSVKTRLEEAIHDLRMVLEPMKVIAQVKGNEEADLIFLDIEGSALGFLIGKNGTTLSALEYIVNIIHNRRFTPKCQILIDIDGYRQKDFQYVEKLISKAVTHISNHGTPYQLYPMSPHLRKLTHLLLRKFPGHESKSTGEGPDRYVEIYSVLDDDTPVFEEITPDHEGTPIEEESDIQVRNNPSVSWDRDDEGSPL